MSGSEKNRNFRILVVDDDDSTRSLLSSVLAAEGYECLTANSVASADVILRQEPVQLALLDLYLGTANGLNVLDLIKVLQPQCACVIMTAHTSVETVTKSLGSGAIEYLGKPLLIDDLLTLVRKVQASKRASGEATAAIDDGPETSIIGRTPKMLEVYRAIARVAPTEASVLILGASGTGKELVARALHDHSSRADKPFVPVNCGALPENILESELFGHEKGAYTGADSSRPGLFEAAHGGTLFLDEISETKPGFQVNLLRAVQEQQIRRVGSHKYTQINVRILAASNRDLEQAVAQGTFRRDLFFRLNVLTLRIPCLRERRPDVPMLVAHFLERLARNTGVRRSVSDEALRIMLSYDWPGNVRELENCLERACAMSSGPVLHVADLPTMIHNAQVQAPAQADNGKNNILPFSELEKQSILGAIEQLNGDKLRAAKLLGIGKTTLYRKLKEYASQP